MGSLTALITASDTYSGTTEAIQAFCIYIVSHPGLISSGFFFSRIETIPQGKLTPDVTQDITERKNLIVCKHILYFIT